MNLALIPLLIAALLLASADPDVEQIQFLLSGEHELVDGLERALIVGDASVGVPAGAEVPGPVFIIGGELAIDGTVRGDVTQLAGTVQVGWTGAVTGELQHVAGSLTVGDDAEIGRRTTLDLTGTSDRGGGVVVQATSVLLLAAAGYLMARRRPDALGNVSAAVRGHPVISLTVGILITLTVTALLVFMAFTLVLIPLTVVGLLAGLITLVYGLIATGHLVGSWLPLQHPAVATAVGVVSSLISIRIFELIPVVGDLLVGGFLLAAVGAVVITYYGAARFRPDPLPD